MFVGGCRVLVVADCYPLSRDLVVVAVLLWVAAIP